MDDRLKSKKALGSVLLLALIGALISYILPELFDPFYSWLQSIVSYKLLLIILILTILIALYSYKNHPIGLVPKLIPEPKLKNNDSRLTEDQENTMKNLSPAEASVLMNFVEQKSKIIKIKIDAPVNGLIYNRILRRVQNVGGT